MRKRQAIIFVLLILAAGARAEKIQLLVDRHFQSGFNVLNPTHGKRVVEGAMDWDKSTEPAWDLAQWNSKYSINGVKLQNSLPDKYVYRNAAKSVTIGKPDSKWADITLAVNSVVEYKGTYRKADEPWPHLLVNQSVTQRCPSLSEMKALNYHLEAKLLMTKTIKGQGYSTGLHCAQIPGVLIIQNLNQQSVGYGDFIWFLIPIYDDRYDFSPLMAMQDCADPSQKLIYSPGAKAFLTEPVTRGKWVTIDKDIYPLIREALKAAWEKGYLKDSQDLNDYKVTSVILGWEVTGLNKVSMQLKNFSLIAATDDNSAKAEKQ